MTTKLILATIAAATITSIACAAPMHHHPAHATASGSEATKALNQKSLEQASAGSTGSPMASRNGAMSDSGSPAPMATPDAAPMGSPANNAMAPSAPGDTATPPATTTPPQ